MRVFVVAVGFLAACGPPDGPMLEVSMRTAPEPVAPPGTTDIRVEVSEGGVAEVHEVYYRDDEDPFAFRVLVEATGAARVDVTAISNGGVPPEIGTFVVDPVELRGGEVTRVEVEAFE